MANQVIVTNNNVQVAIEPTPQVQVQISRAAIGNISANVANYANFAGNAFSVTLSNVVGAGNIASINLDGNVSNVLRGNGSFGPETGTGNSNYANFAGTAFSVSGSNVSGTVANANYATNAGDSNFANYVGYAVQNTVNTSHLVSFVAPGFTANKQVLINGNFIFNPVSETLQVNKIDSNGALLTNITGANVTGTVANATYAANAGYADNAGNANTANIANTAYSVSVGNVSGIGNIATINLDGNSSNVLKGDGTFGPEGTTGNANYAAYAGNVVDNAQPNITSVGTLTALTANTTTSINLTANGANIIANVVEASNLNTRTGLQHFSNWQNNQSLIYSFQGGVGAYIANTAAGNTGFGNIKSLWQFGNDGNLQHLIGGNGVVIAKQLAATAGNVSASVNVVANGNVQGNVVVGNYLYGDGSNISNINGANVSNVANANLATYANIVVDNAQPNITSVGTLTGLTVNSNSIINIATTDSNASLAVTENSNLTTRTALVHINTPQTNFSSMVVGAAGGVVYLANNDPGNVGFGNTKSYWNFGTNGNLDHIFGGTGNVNVKGATLTGNINVGGNVVGNGITINATSSANINGTNANVFLNVTENANLSTRVVNQHFATWANNQTSLFAFNNGVGAYIANTAAGNTGFGNIKSYWQFQTNGNLDHVFGGTGNINPKGISVGFGTGNISAGNLFIGNLYANSGVVQAQYLKGDGSNITGISAGAGGSNTNIQYNNSGALAGSNSFTWNESTKNMQIIGDGSGSSGLALFNAPFVSIMNGANPPTGPFFFSTYDSNAYTSPTRYFRARGNISSPAAVTSSDIVSAQNYSVYADSGNTFYSLFDTQVQVNSNDGAGNVTATYRISPQSAGSTIELGNSSNLSNISAYGNLQINSNSTGQPIVVNQEGNGGISLYQMFTDTSVFAVQNFYRTRGNSASRTAVGTNDTIFTQNYSVKADPGNAFSTIGYQENKVGTNYGNGVVSLVTTFAATNPGSGSSFQISGYDNTNLNGYVQVNAGNIVLDGNNRQFEINGQGNGSSDISNFYVRNGSVNVVENNVNAGYPSFAFQTYENSNGYINPYTFYRARGYSGSPNNVQNGDAIKAEYYYAYGDSGNTYKSIGGYNAFVKSNDNAGNVSGSIYIYTANNNDGSDITLETDDIKLLGNVSTPYQLDYLRTYGSFTSNATQTSNGANTTNYMTFNNTEDANGISIVSSSQLTVARTGRYNIQFSAQLTHSTNQTANIEIWLTKNGSAIANTNSRLTLIKDQPTVAAWNFVDNASSANTYYQLAWASPDTNVQLVAYSSANTLSGVAIPSVIATITPVGA